MCCRCIPASAVPSATATFCLPRCACTCIHTTHAVEPPHAHTRWHLSVVVFVCAVCVSVVWGRQWTRLPLLVPFAKWQKLSYTHMHKHKYTHKPCRLQPTWWNPTPLQVVLSTTSVTDHQLKSCLVASLPACCCAEDDRVILCCCCPYAAMCCRLTMSAPSVQRPSAARSVRI